MLKILDLDISPSISLENVLSVVKTTTRINLTGNFALENASPISAITREWIMRIEDVQFAKNASSLIAICHQKLVVRLVEERRIANRTR